MISKIEKYFSITPSQYNLKKLEHGNSDEDFGTVMEKHRREMENEEAIPISRLQSFHKQGTGSESTRKRKGKN